MAHRRSPQSHADFHPWLRSVGAMLSRGDPIYALCATCHQRVEVDLAKLVASKGADYCLIDRRPQCRFTSGCAGRVRFLYQGHGCLRHLETEPAVNRRIERDWMARQVTLRNLER